MYYGSAKKKESVDKTQMRKAKTWTKAITIPNSAGTKRYQGKRSETGFTE